MTATEWILVAFGIVTAVVVASFTNVIIDRLPLALDEPNEYGELWDTRPWGEVLGGRSRCSACGAEIHWYDNIPLLSYIRLRGHCRDCGAPYGAFHLLVEIGVPVATVLVAFGVVHNGGWTWLLVPWLFLVPIGAAVSTIDLRTLIVPTRIVWPATAISAVLCIGAAFAEGEPRWLLGALIGALVLAGPLFVIWWFVPTGMGFGDVRLCVLLGLNVGLAAASVGRSLAWSALLAVLCLALASIIGIVMALPFLGSNRRKIPFGPALVLSALVCISLAVPILEPFA